MTIEALPPLREVIARYELGAKKSLGQNFLFDLNLTRKIARSAAPLAGYTIVEVGSGPGGLTRALFLEGAENVIAIERDDRAIQALDDIAMASGGRLTIEAADALAFDWNRVAHGKVKIVANLPYNIATPLLVGWLTNDKWPPWFDSLTLMFQREVADRIVAAPGSNAYGRLSVLSQWRCTAKKLFNVNPQAFIPQPKVTSAVVHLVPKPNPYAGTRTENLERVTAAAFGQRRKMLKSSLKSVFERPEETLEHLNINLEKRAEELTVAQFVQIAGCLS